LHHDRRRHGVRIISRRIVIGVIRPVTISVCEDRCAYEDADTRAAVVKTAARMPAAGVRSAGRREPEQQSGGEQK
jgi:hypothetical protein